MTFDEYKNAVNALTIKLNEDNNNRYRMFAVVVNVDTEQATSFGFGCQRCLAEYIVDYIDDFKHIDDMMTKH